MNKEDIKVLVETEIKKLHSFSGMEFYAMATKAYHMLGDLSRDKPNLCVIHGETDGYWVGNWVTGMGFIHVLFPKDTTRDLTDGEFLYYNGRQMRMNSSWMPNLQIRHRLSEVVNWKTR